jgi:hypothetical protein
MNRILTTPVAILVGAVIIAIGLYLGLRERGRPSPAPDRESASATSPGHPSTKDSAGMPLHAPMDNPMGRLMDIPAATPPPGPTPPTGPHTGIAVPRVDAALRARVQRHGAAPALSGAGAFR